MLRGVANLIHQIPPLLSQTSYNIFFVILILNYLKFFYDIDILVLDPSFDQKDVWYRNRKIHVHGRVEWCGKEFMTPGMIWKKPRVVELYGEPIVVPNHNADFLMHLAHINYETFKVTYSDYRYIVAHLLNHVKLGECTEEAKKYKWVNTYLRTLELIVNHEGEFPIYLSRTHMIKAMIERGVTGYALKRLFKSLRILLTGNVERYLDPPERRLF